MTTGLAFPTLRSAAYWPEATSTPPIPNSSTLIACSPVSPDYGPHRAFVAARLAAHAIAAGRGQEAINLTAPYIATAGRHENAALLSQLMLLQAEGLELEGRLEEAGQLRLDSLGWARYGFGPDWAVRSKLREISALSPLKGS